MKIAFLLNHPPSIIISTVDPSFSLKVRHVLRLRFRLPT